MTVAPRRLEQRQRSSLVVHVHVVGGEAMRAALTLMCFSTIVCPGKQSDAQQQASSWRVIWRADTGGYTQQRFITFGDVTIVEHFVRP